MAWALNVVPQKSLKIRRKKSQNLNDSPLVLQFSLPNTIQVLS